MADPAGWNRFFDCEIQPNRPESAGRDSIVLSRGGVASVRQAFGLWEFGL